MSQLTMAPLRPPASKSMAFPLACRETFPEPAIRAPGLQVETMLTGPKFASIRPSSDLADEVRQPRELPPPDAL